LRPTSGDVRGSFKTQVVRDIFRRDRLKRSNRTNGGHVFDPRKGTIMQVARIQPPVALVSALCIAVVPLEGASAAHHLEGVSAVHTNPGGAASPWSVPYNLDSFSSTVFQWLQGEVFGAAKEFDNAGKSGISALQQVGNIIEQLLTLDPQSALYSFVFLIRDTAAFFIPAVVADLVQALLAHFGVHFGPAALTDVSGLVAKAATPTINLAVRPNATSTATPNVTPKATSKAPVAATITPTATPKVASVTSTPAATPVHTTHLVTAVKAALPKR